MKYISLICLTFLLFSSLGFSQTQEEIDKMREDINKEAFEQLSKGMNPEETKALKDHMEVLKKKQAEYLKLSPDEQKEKLDASLLNTDSQNSKEKFKKDIDNMSPEEKEMFKKMIENANEMSRKK